MRYTEQGILLRYPCALSSWHLVFFIIAERTAWVSHLNRVRSRSPQYLLIYNRVQTLRGKTTPNEALLRLLRLVIEGSYRLSGARGTVQRGRSCSANERLHQRAE